MAFKEPADKDLQQALRIAWLLILLAALAPILSLVLPVPAIPELERGGWFGRSGAVTTIFAILAEGVLVRAKLSITPVGFGWVGLQEQHCSLRMCNLLSLCRPDGGSGVATRLNEAQQLRGFFAVFMADVRGRLISRPPHKMGEL